MTKVFYKVFRVLFNIVGVKHCIQCVPFSMLSKFVSNVNILVVLRRVCPLFNLGAPILIASVVLGFIPTIRRKKGVLPTVLNVTAILVVVFAPQFAGGIPTALITLIVIAIISLFLGLSPGLAVNAVPSTLPAPFFVVSNLTNLS